MADTNIPQALTKPQEAPSELAVLLTAVERMASNPNVNADAFVSIMTTMQLMIDRASERRNAEAQREAIRQYNQAMSRAQREMGTIVNDAANPQFAKTATGGRYASLHALVNGTRDTYTGYGFSVMGKPVVDLDGKIVSYKLICAHDGGHQEELELRGTFDVSGAKTGIQSIGSTITYLRRYCFQILFNLVTANDPDDDDGESQRSTVRVERPTPPPQQPAQPQRQTVAQWLDQFERRCVGMEIAGQLTEAEKDPEVIEMRHHVRDSARDRMESIIWNTRVRLHPPFEYPLVDEHDALVGDIVYFHPMEWRRAFIELARSKGRDKLDAICANNAEAIELSKDLLPDETFEFSAPAEPPPPVSKTQVVGRMMDNYDRGEQRREAEAAEAASLQQAAAPAQAAEPPVEPGPAPADKDTNMAGMFCLNMKQLTTAAALAEFMNMEVVKSPLQRWERERPELAKQVRDAYGTRRAELGSDNNGGGNSNGGNQRARPRR